MSCTNDQGANKSKQQSIQKQCQVRTAGPGPSQQHYRITIATCCSIISLVGMLGKRATWYQQQQRLHQRTRLAQNPGTLMLCFTALMQYNVSLLLVGCFLQRFCQCTPSIKCLLQFLLCSFLQAVGCGTVLTKAYCVKKKLCEKHLKVNTLPLT